jgi:hypothetical protein
MTVRAAGDLRCDASAVRWQALGDQGWIARGCERQAQYALRCHEEFEDPARPAYPPIDVCAWVLQSVRPDAPQPSGSPIASPPR